MVPLKFIDPIQITQKSLQLQLLYTSPVSKLLPMPFRHHLTVELCLFVAEYIFAWNLYR